MKGKLRCLTVLRWRIYHIVHGNDFYDKCESTLFLGFPELVGLMSVIAKDFFAFDTAG